MTNRILWQIEFCDKPNFVANRICCFVSGSGKTRIRTDGWILLFHNTLFKGIICQTRIIVLLFHTYSVAGATALTRKSSSFNRLRVYLILMYVHGNELLHGVQFRSRVACNTLRDLYKEVHRP